MDRAGWNLGQLATAILIFGFAAKADTIYRYTGQHFTSVVPPYTTSDYVSGSLTTVTPLAANLVDYSFRPAAFQYTDGVNTVDNADADSPLFTVSTNSSSDIDGWQIFISGGYFAFQIDSVGGIEDVSLKGDYGSDTPSGGSGRSFVSGSWAAPTTTPEPSSIVLFGAGLVIAALLISRGQTHSTKDA